MAPRDASVSTSLFLNKLGSLWVVQSMEELYSASKEKSVLLTAGLEVLEKGVNMASNPVKLVVTSLVETCPDKVSTIDTFACGCLDRLEIKYPAVQEQAGNAVHTAQHALSSGLRRAFRTYPGKQVVRGLDAVIDVSQKMLDSLTPADQCVAEDKAERTEGKDEQQNSGTDEVDDKSVEIGTQTLCLPGIVGRMAAPPVMVWVEFLRQLKRLLIRACGLQHRAMLASLAASPVKKVHIGRRKKLSPKKRLPRHSALRRLTTAAFSAVGFKQWNPLSATHQTLNIHARDEGIDVAVVVEDTDRFLKALFWFCVFITLI